MSVMVGTVLVYGLVAAYDGAEVVAPERSNCDVEELGVIEDFLDATWCTPLTCGRVTSILPILGLIWRNEGLVSRGYWPDCATACET